MDIQNEERKRRINNYEFIILSDWTDSKYRSNEHSIKIYFNTFKRLFIRFYNINKLYWQKFSIMKIPSAIYLLLYSIKSPITHRKLNEEKFQSRAKIIFTIHRRFSEIKILQLQDEISYWHKTLKSIPTSKILIRTKVKYMHRLSRRKKKLIPRVHFIRITFSSLNFVSVH